MAYVFQLMIYLGLIMFLGFFFVWKEQRDLQKEEEEDEQQEDKN